MNWPDFDMTAAVRTGRRHNERSVADVAGHDARVDAEGVERAAGREEQGDHADEQADVADPVGEEGLEGGVGVGLVFPPVSDQHERADADELPAHDDLKDVVAEHHEQHRGREQAQEGEEVGVAAIAGHVVGAVDVDEKRDERDDEQHHHR